MGTSVSDEHMCDCYEQEKVKVQCNVSCEFVKPRFHGGGECSVLSKLNSGEEYLCVYSLSRILSKLVH